MSNNQYVNPWTEDEKAIIVKYYGSDKELVFKKLKHRTRMAIHHKASRLALTAEINDFTEEENNFICNHYFANKHLVFRKLYYRKKRNLINQAAKLKKFGKIDKWSKDEIQALLKDWDKIYLKHFENRKIKS